MAVAEIGLADVLGLAADGGLEAGQAQGALAADAVADRCCGDWARERVASSVPHLKAIAWKQARKSPGGVAELDELLGEAMAGASQAAVIYHGYCVRNLFPEHRRADYFAAYMTRRAQGQMLDYLRKLDHAGRSAREAYRAMLPYFERGAGISEAAASAGISPEVARGAVAAVAARPVSFDPALHDSADETADTESSALVSVVLAAGTGLLRSLPVTAQLVIVLRFFHHLTGAEVAAALGVPEGLVIPVIEGSVMAVHQEVASAAQDAQDGQGEIPAGERARALEAVTEAARAVDEYRARRDEPTSWRWVASGDCGTGCEGESLGTAGPGSTIATIVTPLTVMTVHHYGHDGATSLELESATGLRHVSDADSSSAAQQLARCNGPIHQGAWLPLDQFTMVKRQEGADRRFRADGSRKPRSTCKACHARIQRERYGEQRKAQMARWRARKAAEAKAEPRTRYVFSCDSSHGIDGC